MPLVLAQIPDAVARFFVTYRGPVYSVATLLAFLVVYRIVTRALRKHMLSKAQKPENVQNFLFFWRYVWFGIAFVFALMAFSGSIASLGISAAFLGMIMGWSLQAPVTGIAAWLMIILKRPFKIGDRVIIAGIVGDVVDITLTHIVLNQVGGTIGGEEKSGRGVLIPNATLFQQIIYNYAFETKYLLDEVPVMITYESDVAAATRILLDAARQVTADIVAETGNEPFTRLELADWGIRIRLRYHTVATDRQRISSDIVALILDGFENDSKVEFCYPHTEILYRPKLSPSGVAGEQAPAPPAPGEAGLA